MTVTNITSSSVYFYFHVPIYKDAA